MSQMSVATAQQRLDQLLRALIVDCCRQRVFVVGRRQQVLFFRFLLSSQKRNCVALPDSRLQRSIDWMLLRLGCPGTAWILSTTHATDFVIVVVVVVTVG